MMGVRKLIAFAYCVDAATSQSAFLQSHLDNATANPTGNGTTFGALGSSVGECGSDYRSIYIIRHGERWDKNSELNECGLARAKHLIDVFGQNRPHALSKESEFYAFNYQESSTPDSHQRCRETLHDLAGSFPDEETIKYPSCTPSQRSSPEPSERKKCQPTPPDTWAPHPEIKQPCDPTHLSCIQDQVAAKVLHDRIQHVPSIIVAWEHTNIKHLVHYLADTSKEIEKAVDWPCSEFGRVIDIHYKRWGSGYHYCKTHVFDQSCSACHSHACPHKDCHH
jgi:hypothetical protein